MGASDVPSPWTDLQRRSEELALAQPAPDASPDETRQILDEAISRIARTAERLDEQGQSQIADATMSLLAAAGASPSIGVCRAERPFASLYVVLEADGRGAFTQRVCCTHTTQHCAP